MTSVGEVLVHMEARSLFFDQIKNSQFEDKKLSNLREKILQGEAIDSIIDNEGVLNILACL